MGERLVAGVRPLVANHSSPGSGAPVRWPRKRRITRSLEFRRVREEGMSYRGRCLILAVLRQESLTGVKVGFITSKRLGKAVVRNRVRRRLRAILAEVGDRIEGGRCLVTVARPAAAEAAYQDLKLEWIRLGQRAGIFRRQPQPGS